MDRPLILISASTEREGIEFDDYSISLSRTYLDAIEQAGGLPLAAPPAASEEMARELIARCDGLLLTGGDDVQPELYAPDLAPELRAKVIDPDPVRDFAETLLIKEIFLQRKPLLAICRGHQILNVTLGGTLIVDIPSQVQTEISHSQLRNKDRAVHEVRLESESMLARTLGKTTVEVNSTHHQAVGRVAAPLRVTGRSPDGIVEVMELKESEAALLPYLLGVQFHPERLVRERPAFLELFRGFVQACAMNRSERNQGARYEAQSAGGG